MLGNWSSSRDKTMAQRSTSMNSIQPRNVVARPKQVGVVTRTQRSTLANLANKKLPTKVPAVVAAKPTAKIFPRALPTRLNAAKPTARVPEAKVVKPVEAKSEDVAPEPANSDVQDAPSAFSSKILNVTDIDKYDGKNELLLSYYIDHIYDYLRALEKESVINENHLSGKLVNGKMRGILVDWLIEVHARFGLLQETLFLTVAVIDLYLQAVNVPKEKLQLVGIAAMFTCSKYEEIHAPEAADFVHVTDNTYSKSAVLKMERSILSKLDFCLGRPTVLHFLRRNTKAASSNAVQHTMAKYFLELSMVDYAFAHYSPSLMAAAALYLSLKIDKVPWTDTLVHYSKCTESEVLPLARKLARLVRKSPLNRLKAVDNKYGSDKMLKVSTSPQLHSATILDMASGAD